jgi:hypothetical protein
MPSWRGQEKLYFYILSRLGVSVQACERKPLCSNLGRDFGYIVRQAKAEPSERLLTTSLRFSLSGCVKGGQNVCLHRPIQTDSRIQTALITTGKSFYGGKATGADRPTSNFEVLH